MAAQEQEQQQEEGRKTGGEQDYEKVDRAASSQSVDQAVQASQTQAQQVDITQLRSLSQLIPALKQRLPEVDEKTISQIAEVQQKANSVLFRRVYLSQAEGHHDLSDALALVMEHTTPLNQDNWSRWSRELRLNMCMISCAEELLFGEDDFEYTPYLMQLDRRLMSTIFLTLEAGGPGALRYQLMRRRDEWSTGRELLKYLESQYKRCGDWKQVWTLLKLNRVKVIKGDLDKAIEEINRLACDAFDTGMLVTEAHMCATLLNLTIGKTEYVAAWTHLQSAKACNDWFAVTRALRSARDYEEMF